MALPQAIGPYRIVRELGRGGMGVVYEAEDPALGRRVALKQVLMAGADLEALQRFRREAEALAKVRHAGVVTVHACGESSQGPYLVTELVPGEPLDRLLARGPLDPRSAAALVAELADAVAALHAAGLLHRDLKPSNVIVRPSGSPVLLDFGLVRELAAETLTQSGTVLGTPGYMAPEQAKGVSPRELDGRVDVYGLGAVLFACLTGRSPHQGRTPMATLLAVLEREPEWPAAAPPDLLAIAKRALAKDPARRFPDAASLRGELERFLTGRPARRGAGRAAGWRGAIAGLAGVAALLAAILGAPGGPQARPPDLVAPQPERSDPVVTPVAASTLMVNAVLNADLLSCAWGYRFRSSHRAPVRGTQISPRP